MVSMKERPSTFSSSGAARDENHVERSEVWNGEPRVIYHDVENRLESLKRARRLAHAGAVGPGPGSAASAMGKEDEEIASSMRDRFGPLDDEIVHDAKRFVDVIFDPPGEMYGYFQGESQVPRVEVMVVDRRGQERRAVYSGGEMERVEVGSVIVVRDPKAGSEVPIAAYLVGDENYQVFLVGNGVACVPTLLTQEMYEAIGGIRGSRKYWFALNRNLAAGAPETSGPHDYAGFPADDDSAMYEDEDDDEFGDIGYDDESDFAANAQQEGWDYGDDAYVGAAHESRPGVFGEGEEAEAARKAERALVLREAALQAIAGKGRSVRGEARRGYDLFRRAADMGDADSYVYLALLQSAGLGEGGSEAGWAQSRTWAMCGVSGFRTDAALLLAFRYHAGRGERRICPEGARFYQMAIDELRLVSS